MLRAARQNDNPQSPKSTGHTSIKGGRARLSLTLRDLALRRTVIAGLWLLVVFILLRCKCQIGVNEKKGGTYLQILGIPHRMWGHRALHEREVVVDMGPPHWCFRSWSHLLRSAVGIKLG